MACYAADTVASRLLLTPLTQVACMSGVEVYPVFQAPGPAGLWKSAMSTALLSLYDPTYTFVFRMSTRCHRMFGQGGTQRPNGPTYCWPLSNTKDAFQKPKGGFQAHALPTKPPRSPRRL